MFFLSPKATDIIAYGETIGFERRFNPVAEGDEQRRLFVAFSDGNCAPLNPAILAGL